MKSEILAILPNQIRQFIQMVEPTIAKEIEEIRLRENRPLEISYLNRFAFLTSKGKMTLQEQEAYIVSHDDILKMLNLISNHSIYRLEEELKRGYITVNGGHRIGISGKVILEHGEVKSIKDISSFNIRIAKQKIGVANKVIPYLIADRDGKVHNTLIISPPQCGKTTLLRDIARQLSIGVPTLRLTSKKVGIVDERSEIAGCVFGVPQNDVGPRTDVLDACPKAEGMMMMIRSMSPEILIVDEIGRKEDADAIFEARNAGVSIIATAHGSNIAEIANRPSISSLIQQGIFTRYVILSRNQGVGTIERILNEELKPVLREKSYA
ncbi:stage III sporulation protein AA [Tepidibacillus fermentans]|uniref:Stage III sporulation protein AA n=1 Tax=Tepidibacillus fermentans TaxID=1281767 RepID=A0A4R3KJT7_9BACI|nr:stage III sporulation protein AA [Tepidibacillus fermentans]TCS84023.1 stage III sporulation protein AA [Tepidibacillus fermentans]